MIDFIQPQRSLPLKQWWMLIVSNLWKYKLKKKTNRRLKVKTVSVTIPDESTLESQITLKLLANSIPFL